MAIVNSNDFGWILSQDLFFKQVYEKTKVGHDLFKAFEFQPAFFDIKAPFKKPKKVILNAEETAETGLVRNAYQNMLDLLKNSSQMMDDNDLSLAKISADDFYNDKARHPRKIPFHGGNNSDVPLLTTIEDEDYLIPQKSFFYCDDVREMDKYFKDETFDFILLDPPWWNKYIRRKRKKNQCQAYEMLYNEELKKINVERLLNEAGLIALWCTNAPSHINFIKNDLFSSWGVKYVSQWFWMKVTKSGLPVCSFTQPLGKQPYERIIFGVKKNSIRCHNPEDNKIIMSVPSSIHSQKPPLSNLMENYLPKDFKALELFARYLLPNWTSFGNEVLKLQHVSLYKEDSK